MVDINDDDGLEEAMRSSLRTHAERFEGSHAVVHRARMASRRRQRLRVATWLLSAAVVISGVAVAVHVSHHSRGGAVAVDQPPTSSMTRTEYWRGLQVEVPAAWGWGAAPIPYGSGHLQCGDHRGAYVGRATRFSRDCNPVSLTSPTSVPYVWLGVDLPVGTVDLGDGWTRQTRVVAGSTVSVATDDPALRARILDSARPQTLCPVNSDGVHAPSTTQATEGTFGLQPQRLIVCGYLSDIGPATEPGGNQLAYAADLGAGPAKAFTDAILRSPIAPSGLCGPNPAGGSGAFATLRVEGPTPFGSDVRFREYIASYDICGDGEIDTPAGPELGTTRQITPATLAPWLDSAFRGSIPFYAGAI